jgi:TatD DNase family protein
MLIDTHCHLTFPDLAPQIAAVLERARAAGVTRVINVATTLAEARAGFELLADHTGVCFAAGIHPHEAARCGPDDLAALTDLFQGRWRTSVRPQRLVAVGETGLDFHYDFAPRDTQERVFRTHLELAVDASRPVVIHAREAEERVCDILADYPPLAGRVVFHCYSADVATTRRIIDQGNCVSFTGVVTFKNAATIRAAARFAPLDRIMVETDAPYLAPDPVRKVRPNEPALLVHTARFLAELRGEPTESFAAATTANAIRFFNLPEDQP